MWGDYSGHPFDPKHKVHFPSSTGTFSHIALPISCILMPFVFLVWFSVILTQLREKLAHFQKQHFHLYSINSIPQCLPPDLFTDSYGEPIFYVSVSHSQLSKPHNIKMLLFLNNDMTVTHPHSAPCQLGISEPSAGREVPI